MSGTIGLTNAGKYLDICLQDLDPKSSRKIIKFIDKITRVSNSIHQNIEDESKIFILKIMRNHFLDEHANRFKSVDEKIYSLMTNYIKTVTKHDFIPSTKTQLDLLQKNTRT